MFKYTPWRVFLGSFHIGVEECNVEFCFRFLPLGVLITVKRTIQSNSVFMDTFCDNANKIFPV